ncbi:hypothetical protein PRIPAC_86904 [Pristionchus pacificus]|uniref:DEK_C domain-containing protein n=1 Tax=Pristionchus pacificus TaxID=54126 RepID=A0A2A6CCM8_PRIPA|nr:hypothetical protein PRIPAC_86904 [Pristionchus pacificus]|eukprot:PDM75793.1 hypothetical protein PRIPAC_40172 [Pristionchus pacificus]
MADAQETQIKDKVIESDGGIETIPVDKKDELLEGTSLEVKSPSKNAAKSSTKSPAKSPKKPPAEKSPVKSVLSSPKKSSKEESEDEDEEEEDEKKGLYDLPVVVEGKRKRESTSFLKTAASLGRIAGLARGRGQCGLAHQLDSEKKLVDLRPLYRICFGTQGKMNLLRKELKTFNGYSFAKDSVEYKKKMELANKNNTRAELGHIRRLLGVGAAKTKEEEVQLILEFLIKPHDEGKNVPKKATKRKSSSKTSKPAKKSKKEKATKKMTSKETVDTESDEREKSSDSEEEEEEEVKVTTPKKTPMKRKAVEQKMKTPTKKTKKADRVEEPEEGDDHSITSSSDSSEKKDEKVELIPSDKELQEKITELLKTFDLTSVSMKQMVMSVCEAFPEHPQLKERSFTIKTFIKDAIKDVD